MTRLRRTSSLFVAVSVLALVAAGALTACADEGSTGVAVVDGTGGDEPGSADGGDGGAEGDSSDGADDDAGGGGAGASGPADTDGDNGDDASDVTATSAAASADDRSLPGEPFEIGPPAGERLDVVGVRHDDVLNFREGPSPSSPIVDTVAPQSVSPAITSSGEGRLLTRSAWWKVTVGGETAWANFRFLGTLGATDDVFDDLAAALPSTSAATVEALIDDIAQSRAGGPEPAVELVTPLSGLDADGAEVTVDVIGIGDDAVKGERFLLTFDLTFDDPDAADREVVSYELVGARRTVICGRGLTGDACT